MFNLGGSYKYNILSVGMHVEIKNQNKQKRLKL